MDDLETSRAEISDELKGLEQELCSVGIKFSVNRLRAFRHYQGCENYFFTISIGEDHVGIGKDHVGTALPFRKLAFCGNPLHNSDEDPVLKSLKICLEARGYSVEYSSDLPYTVLSKLNKS